MTVAAKGDDPVAFRPLQRDAKHFDVDASSDALADVLDVSLETVRRLEGDGHLEKIGRGRFAFLASIRKYVGHLRDVAAGRGGGDEQASQAAENALLAREKRVNLELRNAQLRGDMVRATDVEVAWAEDWANVRTHLLAVPARMASACPHLSRSDINELDRLVRKALTEASTRDDRRAGTHPGEGAREAATAAETTPE